MGDAKALPDARVLAAGGEEHVPDDDRADICVRVLARVPAMTVRVAAFVCEH